jgi:hypothetical protein
VFVLDNITFMPISGSPAAAAPEASTWIMVAARVYWPWVRWELREATLPLERKKGPATKMVAGRKGL